MKNDCPTYVAEFAAAADAFKTNLNKVLEMLKTCPAAALLGMTGPEAASFLTLKRAWDALTANRTAEEVEAIQEQIGQRLLASDGAKLPPDAEEFVAALAAAILPREVRR